jgi:hypothetical protein
MNILDKRFKYTPAARTDIRKLFQRIRREQEQAQKEQAQKVQPLKVARG